MEWEESLGEDGGRWGVFLSPGSRWLFGDPVDGAAKVGGGSSGHAVGEDSRKRSRLRMGVQDFSEQGDLCG